MKKNAFFLLISGLIFSVGSGVVFARDIPAPTCSTELSNWEMDKNDPMLTAVLKECKELRAFLIEKAIAQAKKPPVRIGMTTKQVKDGTNWGEPEVVNASQSANGTVEEWVYGAGNFVYFKNGRVTSIQTRK